MSVSFLLRYQESCPLEDSIDASCATKTVTLTNAEQGDADRSRQEFGALSPIALNPGGNSVIKFATQTITRASGEQADADPRNVSYQSVPTRHSATADEVVQADIRMATQTVTQVHREQRDADPKNMAYHAIPLAPLTQTAVQSSPSLMATQTGTKTRESRDQDRAGRLRRVIPRAFDSDK